MRIKRLVLKNFRNYEEETFEFADGINVLYGKNAQGKTNCAEAVFYLCTGVSPRTSRDKQMIRNGTDCASISAQAQTRFGEVSIAADLYETKREIRINGNKITRNADLLGNINGVFFSPGELRMIQDGPEERRRFMNMSVSQLSRSYYTALVRYNKILEQRNALLKNRDLSLVFETLPVWDAQLCKYAAELISARRDFIAELSPIAAEKHAFLTGGEEQLEVSPDMCCGKTKKEIAEAIAQVFSANYEKDVRLGYTTAGPHRDDLKILINGEEARVYGSQGQMRTAALSLKLAEADVFAKAAGEPPVLVLDDVMSELDLARRRKLLAQIEGMQTVLTCTHAETVLYGREINKIRISDGKIRR